MSIRLDLNKQFSIAAANTHYYKVPTEERYIDRILPYHDFIYLIEGSWTITENEVEYPLSKGDVLLLTAGQHHYTRWPCQEGTRTFCLHVDMQSGIASGTPNIMQLPTLIHAQGAPRVKNYFEELVSSYWAEDDPYKEKRMGAIVDLLLLELYAAQRQHDTQQNSIADQAIAMITSMPHRRLTAEEVASKLFISTKTLNNAMNKKTSMPFYAYQLNLKLEMIAKQLEMEPDLRMLELAHAFGFYDEFHMSKAFKKKYGISPQLYKKSRSSESNASGEVDNE